MTDFKTVHRFITTTWKRQKTSCLDRFESWGKQCFMPMVACINQMLVKSIAFVCFEVCGCAKLTELSKACGLYSALYWWLSYHTQNLHKQSTSFLLYFLAQFFQCINQYGLKRLIIYMYRLTRLLELTQVIYVTFYIPFEFKTLIDLLFLKIYIRRSRWISSALSISRLSW